MALCSVVVVARIPGSLEPGSEVVMPNRQGRTTGRCGSRGEDRVGVQGVGGRDDRRGLLGHPS